MMKISGGFIFMFNTFSYKNTADNVVVMSEDNYDAIMEPSV